MSNQNQGSNKGSTTPQKKDESSKTNPASGKTGSTDKSSDKR